MRGLWRNSPCLLDQVTVIGHFKPNHLRINSNHNVSEYIEYLSNKKESYRIKWIQYVSFEHEIESRKSKYYRVLRSCQAKRPNENVNEWVNFFFEALKNIQNQLLNKLEQSGIETKLSPKEKSIITFIGNNPGCKSGDIAKRLDIPNPTVKRILPELINKNLIEKHGNGPGTNYTIK